jgi:hypothetical protein
VTCSGAGVLRRIGRCVQIRGRFGKARVFIPRLRLKLHSCAQPRAASDGWNNGSICTAPVKFFRLLLVTIWAEWRPVKFPYHANGGADPGYSKAAPLKVRALRRADGLLDTVVAGDESTRGKDSA